MEAYVNALNRVSWNAVSLMRRGKKNGRERRGRKQVIAVIRFRNRNRRGINLVRVWLSAI
jgi:hypothetical protein